MTAEVGYEHADADAARPLVDELVAVYTEVYAEADQQFFNEGRYRRQLAGHMQTSGWTLVTAFVGADIAGYIYGFPLPAGARWWGGLVPPIPDGFAEEDGHRTFAISEILVRAPWRRRGIAGGLHDELLSSRSERRATLLVEPDNTPAQAAYDRWGWEHVARLRPSWEHAPLYDVLVLHLGGRGAQG